MAGYRAQAGPDFSRGGGFAFRKAANVELKIPVGGALQTTRVDNVVPPLPSGESERERQRQALRSVKVSFQGYNQPWHGPRRSRKGFARKAMKTRLLIRSVIAVLGSRLWLLVLYRDGSC